MTIIQLQYLIEVANCGSFSAASEHCFVTQPSLSMQIKALEEELEDGRFHAMLDVFEYEPPKPDSPLYKLPNVTIMPHMGGPTIDLRQIIARELLNETAMYLNNTVELQSEITKEMAAMMSLG